MLTQSFLLILATSLWTLGLWYASDDEMLLHPLRLFLDHQLGDLAKPLLTCPYCMPSVHGFMVVTVYHAYREDAVSAAFFLQLIFVAVSAVFFNMLLISIVNALQWVVQYFENEHSLLEELRIEMNDKNENHE